MKKLDGYSILTICVCVCIVVSLGYVKLCNRVATRVNNPNTAEFWQVRKVALQLRNPEKEARTAFASGAWSSFDPESITDSSDHRVVDHIRNAKPTVNMAYTASINFGFWQGWNETDAGKLEKSYDAFIDTSAGFAMKYNREMTRLINRR